MTSTHPPQVLRGQLAAPAPPPTRRSRNGRTVGVLGAVVLLVAAVPFAALRADAAPAPSSATGRAAVISSPVASFSSSTAAATSDGTTGGDDSAQQVGLGAGNTASAGVAVARATAAAAGGVTACAAVLGSGGSLSQPSGGACTASAGSPTVVVLVDNAASLVVKRVALKFNAVVASCSVDAPAGRAQRSASVAGGTVEITDGLGGVVSVPIPSGGGSVTLPLGLGGLVVGSGSSTDGSPSRAGSAQSTGLSVSLGGPVSASVVLARVDCGVPTFLLPAVTPWGSLVVVGGAASAAWVSRRRWWPSTRALVTGVR